MSLFLVTHFSAAAQLVDAGLVLLCERVYLYQSLSEMLARLVLAQDLNVNRLKKKEE